MITVKKYFNINDDVDFLNVNLEADNRCYLDPVLLYKFNDEFCINAKESIKDYFADLLDAAVNNNLNKATYLTSNLVESNEVRLGYSNGTPNGTGFGNNNGFELYKLIEKSKAINSGLLSDLFDMSILIPNVDRDRISDFTINIIFTHLIDYTHEQAKLYGIPMVNVELKHKVWNTITKKWEKINVELPVYNNYPIVLVPKRLCRNKLIFSKLDFYNNVMLPEYEKYALANPSHGLVRILKDGNIKPSRVKIRKEFPFTVSNILNFIEKNPEIYRNYKEKFLEYRDID